MATNVTMPRMSESMEEGTVLRWLVPVGAEVRRGDPLVEIETDKANMTYEADADGVLLEVLAHEGQVVPTGQVIARIGIADDLAGNGGPVAGGRPQEDLGDAAAAASPERPTTAVAEPAVAEPAVAEPAVAVTVGGTRAKASPIARRLARELGLDLRAITGTGPGGRIVKSDIEAAAGVPASDAHVRETARGARTTSAIPAADLRAKGDPAVRELTRLQRTVGRRMAESKATAPDFHLHVEIEMDRCLELRAQLAEIADPPPTLNDMVVKAVAKALREFPRVNGAYRDGRWELYPRVNVGVAVAAHESLIVPTIFDADAKPLTAIARETRGLIARVRDETITQAELAGGTFTVSNLGMYGIDSFSAVINPPQAAILAIGAVKRRPVVDSLGEIAARQMLSATLACDHRILYGADGAEFLARVRSLLEQPLSLIVE